MFLKKNFVKSLILILILSFMFSSALGSLNGNAIDQGNIDWDSFSAASMQDILYYPGQSFHPSQENITQIDLYLFKETGYALSSINLWVCNSSWDDTSPNIPIASEIVNQTTIDTSLIPAADPDWVTVSFSPPNHINVEIDAEYWLVLYAPNDDTKAIRWMVYNDVYSGGQKAGNPTLDLRFRTWYGGDSVEEFSSVQNSIIILVLPSILITSLFFRKNSKSR